MLITTCPYCGYDQCTAETVDIGVGEIQSGPYGCDRCHAVQINSDDLYGPNKDMNISEEERRIGWYKGDAT